MKSMTCVVGLALLLAAVQTAGAIPIDVVITVDNAYGFGFGDVNSITTYFGGIRNLTKEDIYDNAAGIVIGAPSSPYTIPGVGPEVYQLNLVSVDDYVYIVAWSDDLSYQGAIAGFQLPNQTLLSGAGTWEVYATGKDRDSPILGDTLTLGDLPLINAEITTANANGGGSGTSIGWVDENGLLPNATLGLGALAIGPANVPNALFNFHDAIDQVSGQSHWMWYNEDPASIPNAFQHSTEGTDGHKEFLIFRTRVGDVLAEIPEPSTLVIWALGLLGMGMCARRWRK